MKYKIVKVTWIDAQRVETQVERAESLIDLEPIPCDIVGFLIHETESKVILAQENWTEENSIKYIHVIPKISIIKIEELATAKKKRGRKKRASM